MGDREEGGRVGVVSETRYPFEPRERAHPRTDRMVTSSSKNGRCTLEILHAGNTSAQRTVTERPPCVEARVESVTSGGK